MPTIVLLIAIIISWNLNREYRAIPSSVYSGPGMFKAIFLGETPLAEDQYYQQVKKFWEILSELPIKNTEEHRNYNEFNYNLIEKFKKNKGLSSVGWLLVFVFISTLSVKFSGKKYKENGRVRTSSLWYKKDKPLPAPKKMFLPPDIQKPLVSWCVWGDLCMKHGCYRQNIFVRSHPSYSRQ